MPKKGENKEFTPSFQEKRSKKHTLLGGIKVSSQQLSKWGELGGRPRKWINEAERKRVERLRKKQEKFGLEAEIRDYKSYGEVKVKERSVICPNCGKVEQDLSRYFNERGEFVKESYWFDSVRMEKVRVKENKFECNKCFYSYSFKDGEVVVNVMKIIEKRAGSSGERVRRFREKNLKEADKLIKKS